jgi:hypothetical protein
MLVGGTWCAVGIFVTEIAYATASDGGVFVVAWGAILFGGLQFLAGLVQFLGTRR